MAYQRDISREATETGVAFLRDKGMEVYEPSAEELDAFKTATKPAYDAWAAKVGEDIVKAFEDTIAATD